MVQFPFPTAPFKRIKNPGESITIDTAGKILVIPSGNSSYLSSWNEYTLNSNRLTIAENPFGGMKGGQFPPDYGVGTIYVNSGDGIYLTDINGSNTSKILSAGKLKEVNSLTIDTTAKTITQEFILENLTAAINSGYIEINIPDNLADTSLSISCWDGSSYQLCESYKLDSTYFYVSGTPANWKFLDATTLDSLYGAGGGRAVFIKGGSGETKSGSSGNITYSSNKGTRSRIGIMIQFQSYNAGTPTKSKIRLKTVLSYASDQNGKYASAYEFEDSLNASYGLQNMVKPFIALYDPVENYIDFFLFTHRPKNLTRKRDDSGNIYEITLYPGNGSIYRGRFTNEDLTIDSNSNLIPNCLEDSITGSVSNFLRAYGFNDDNFLEYDLSSSAITTNDFNIQAADLDIIPFAVSEGDQVSTGTNTYLPVAETIVTQTGNVSIVDVKNQNIVRVRNTAYTNGGDCKVWDTGTPGETNENKWKRVYSTDWVFSGDTVIENGLIKLKQIVNNSSFIMSCVVSGTDTTVINNTMTPNTVKLILISPDSVTFSYLTNSPAETVTVTMRRGSQFVAADKKFIINGIPGNGRFAATNDALYDAKMSNLGVSGYMTIDSSSYYGASIDPSRGFISCYVPTSGEIRGWIFANNLGISSIECAATTTPRKVGAIPFDCSKLYYEAEAAVGIGGGGSSYYTGSDAYPGTGNTGVTLSTLDSNAVIATFTIKAGTYKVFVRAKSVSATSAGRLYLIKGSPRVVYYTLSLNGLNGSGWQTISMDLTVSSANESNINALHLYNTANVSIDIDYVLIVPTGLIEKYAKRALWNPSPFTKTFKTQNR